MLYSILIVELSNGRWSFSIVKGEKRVYNSSASWATPQETWEVAKEEYASQLLNLN